MNEVWSHPPGSNRRPADYESAALPTELGWRSFVLCNLRLGQNLVGFSYVQLLFPSDASGIDFSMASRDSTATRTVAITDLM